MSPTHFSGTRSKQSIHEREASPSKNSKMIRFRTGTKLCGVTAIAAVAFIALCLADWVPALISVRWCALPGRAKYCKQIVCP
jgi:hypothetical protein